MLDAGDASPALDAASDTGAANDAPSEVDASGAFEGEGTPWVKPAPRATCASGDVGDPGTQGFDGDLRCNVQVAGKLEVPHFLSMAWYKDCAYVNGNDSTAVIDVSDSTKPTLVTTLTTAGMTSNWESMKVNQTRGVLVGYQSFGPVMDVYDVAADCKAPVFKGSLALGGGLSIGHAGNFSPDGTIYYASSLFSQTLFAVDIMQMDAPKVITQTFVGTDGMPINTHDLSIEKDGTRGYLTFTNSASGLGNGTIAIVDTSSIQARAKDAKGVAIKQVTWPDGSTTQFTTLVSIRGKDHLIVTDELGSGNCDDPNKPQFGYARIFDISDETDPKLVAKILTEALDPKNCMEAIQKAGGGLGFGVGTHYCNVDRTTDPRLLACGFWEGGLRIFDIRNPWQPKEVAYFDTMGGSVPGRAHFRLDRKEVWVTTGNTGSAFFVLKFPEGSPVDQILSAP